VAANLGVYHILITPALKKVYHIKKEKDCNALSARKTVIESFGSGPNVSHRSLDKTSSHKKD
jgi:hypothetical protein